MTWSYAYTPTIWPSVFTVLLLLILAADAAELAASAEINQRTFVESRDNLSPSAGPEPMPRHLPA